jgi:hypothetical protein
MTGGTHCGKEGDKVENPAEVVASGLGVMASGFTVQVLVEEFHTTSLVVLQVIEPSGTGMELPSVVLGFHIKNI